YPGPAADAELGIGVLEMVAHRPRKRCLAAAATGRWRNRTPERTDLPPREPGLAELAWIYSQQLGREIRRLQIGAMMRCCRQITGGSERYQTSPTISPSWRMRSGRGVAAGSPMWT